MTTRSRSGAPNRKFVAAWAVGGVVAGVVCGVVSGVVVAGSSGGEDLRGRACGWGGEGFGRVCMKVEVGVVVGGLAGVGGKERKKQTLACDRCRMRKRKCDGARPCCRNCAKGGGEDADSACVYTVQTKKRGPKKGYKEELMDRMASIEAIVRQPVVGMSGYPSLMDFGTDAKRSTVSVVDRMDFLAKEAVRVKTAEITNMQYSQQQHQQQQPMALAPLFMPERVVPPLVHNSLSSNHSMSVLNGMDANGFHNPDLVFDFGESLFSFQSIIGQSFLPTSATSWDAPDSLSRFLDELDSPFLASTPMNIPPRPDSVIFSSAPHTSTFPKTASPPTSSTYTLTNLENNLVHLFFSNLSLKIFLFHDAYFISDLRPTNKHPSHLIWAICAVTCLFSENAEIDAFGNTRTACADFSSRSVKEMDALSEGSELGYDSLEVVQSLMLLALVEYGFNQPLRAYRKLVLAIQMCFRLRIDQEDPTIATNPLSIWLEQTTFYSPDALLARRKLWEFCVYFDTCVGMAGALPLVISETAYTYLLSMPAATNPEAAVDAALASGSGGTTREGEKLRKLKEVLVRDRTRTQDGWRVLVEFIRDPPMDTVYNALGLTIVARPEEMYGEYNLIVNQLSFLLRRVIRANYNVRTGGLGVDGVGGRSSSAPHMNPGKRIVEGLLPPSNDVVTIHNAIIDFYNILPVSYQPFLSFAQFIDILGKRQTHQHALAEGFDPTQLHVINILTHLFSALVMLHLPRTDDTRAVFKLDSVVNGYNKVASAEVVLIARKAMVFFVKGFLPKAEDEEDDPFMTASTTTATTTPGGINSFHETTTDQNHQPTFASRVDQTVFSIVGQSEAESAERRSRMPLSSLVLEYEPAVRTHLYDDSNKPGAGAACVAVFCDPIIGFNIFTVAVAALAVCHGDNNASFNREVLKRVEVTIEGVDLPVMDCITFIWPICASFSDRLKRILQVVKKKLN
ncbi:hypothetical protein HDU98_012217 [Podochytrium sp. JEL0797]|nr:hypothetical protein HDU98_012217 [Podochytrium sp. JEL0797]